MALRSNELMIGDWVYKDNTPVQILALNLFVGKEHEDIKPIPLTPEILEKNGFKKENEKYIWREPMSGYIGQTVSATTPSEISFEGRLCVISNQHIGRIFYGGIDYVHELQHGLKFIGIDKTIEL